MQEQLSLGLKKPAQTGYKLVQLLRADLALPHNEYTPAELSKSPALPKIARFIALQFGTPEGDPRLWHSVAHGARVLVPEAPMHENDLSLFGEDKVRPAGQPFVMQPVPIAH